MHFWRIAGAFLAHPIHSSAAGRRSRPIASRVTRRTGGFHVNEPQILAGTPPKRLTLAEMLVLWSLSAVAQRVL